MAVHLQVTVAVATRDLQRELDAKLGPSWRPPAVDDPGPTYVAEVRR